MHCPISNTPLPLLHAFHLRSPLPVNDVPGHTVSMFTISRISPEDWKEARALRLRALEQDPMAFGSTLAREESLEPAEWERRLRENHWYWAHGEQGPVGLAVCMPEDGDVRARRLISMWVEERVRGTAVASELFWKVASCAYGDGADRLVFCVMSDNTRAKAFYEREGALQLDRASTEGSGVATARTEEPYELWLPGRLLDQRS